MKKLSSITLFLLSFFASNLHGSYYLTNNYNLEINNLTFHSSSSTINSTPENIAPNSNIIIPSATVLAQCQITFPNNNTLPFYLPVSGQSSSNIYGTGTLTNNSGSTAYVKYTGIINGTSSYYCLGTLTIINGQTIPNFTGIGSIKGYTSSSATDAAFTITSANANTSYILTSPTTYTILPSLTNNYGAATNTITMYAANGTTIVQTTPSLSPWNSISIPSNVATIAYQASSSNRFYLAANNTNLNAYTNNILTNNTDQTIIIESYSANYSATGISGLFTLLPYTSYPIPTGVSSVIVYNSTATTILIPQTSITSNTSSYLITNNPSWSINAYQPTLNNNGATTASNLNFYNSNNQLLAPSGLSFPTTPAINTPANASYATMYNNDLASQIQIPINFPYQNVFNGQTIVNNTNQTLSINYYGVINQVSDQLLNTTSISLNTGQSTPILTGAVSVSITDTAGDAPINKSPLASNTSYYIYEENNALSMTVYPSNTSLVNNYTTEVSHVKFYTTNPPSGSPINPQAQSIIAGGTLVVPDNALSTIFTQTINTTTTNISIPINENSNGTINIVTGNNITNNSSNNVTINYYSSNNKGLNNTPIALTSLTTTPLNNIAPIITGTSYFTVTYNGTVVATSQTLITGQNYFINFDTNLWSINTYTSNYYVSNAGNPTTAPTSSLTQLNFYNSSSTTPLNLNPLTLNVGSSIAVPTTATYATCSDTINGSTTNILIPVYGSSSNSNFFTGNSVTNNSQAILSVSYYNNQTQLINSSPILISANQAIPLITGTEQISITSTSGSTPITLAPITSNNNYYVNDTAGTLSLANYPALFSLSNSGNSTTAPTASMTNLFFYDVNNNPINSSPITIPVGSSYSVPSNAVSARCNDVVNGYQTNLKIPVYGTTQNSNLFTGQSITNNSTTSLVILYYGTINNVPNIQMSQYIGLPAFNQVVPILTGATSIQINTGSSSVTYANIEPATSYYINNINGQVSLNSFQASYTLTNSGNPNGATASNLNFYNATSLTPLNTTPVTLTAGQATNIPNQAVYATCSDTFNTTATQITIPVYGSSASSTLCTNNTITNNSTGIISIQYYGTINGSEQLLNNTDITASINDIVPIVTGAQKVSITSSSQSAPIVLQTLNTQTSYYVNDKNNVLQLSIGTLPLTNNYNQTTGSITFQNGSTFISTVNGLSQWSSVAIPLDATNASFTDVNSTLTIPVSSFSASNIFENYCLYNNYNTTINVTFYGTLNENPLTALNSPAIAVPAGSAIPIINNSAALAITSSGHNYPQTALGSTTTSYQVIDGSTALQVLAYTPTLHNNYENATGLTFLQSNDAIIPPIISSFNTGTTASIPANATSAKLQDLGVTLTIPTSLAVDSYLFTPNTITNTVNQTASICFTATINDDDTSYMNTTGIAIPAFESIQIPTGATSIAFLQAGNVNPVGDTPLVEGQSYFINQSTSSGAWSVSTTAPLSNGLLTNNTNPGQTVTDVQFFNTNTFLLEKVATLPSTANSNSVTIPQSATYATYLQNFNNNPTTITIPVTDTSSSNLDESYVLYNISTQTVTVNFYGSASASTFPYLLNDNPISIPARTALPILTSTANVSIFAASQPVITNQTITSNSSYYIDNVNDAWTLTSNAPATQFSLTNNSQNNAATLTFFNQNNVAIGNLSNLPTSTSTPIPATTTSMTLNYLGCPNLLLPLSDSQSSNLISQSVITNNTGQTIGIVYYATINGQPLTACNNINTLIYDLNNSNSPILANATHYSIYDSTSTLRINQAPITTNTSYIIHNNWSQTPVTITTNLTNNYGNNVNNLTFYNGTNPIGTVTNPFYNGNFAQIPVGATIASFTTSTSDVTIPVHDTIASNVVISNSGNQEIYTLTNNSGQTITLTFYGTLNATPNSPINSTAITITPGLSIPIFTGTQNVSISYQGTPELVHAPMNLNTNYYINLNDTLWSLNAYESIATITNNYNATATVVKFFDSNDDQINVTVPSWTYNTSLTTPTTCQYATLTDLGSVMTIPLTGQANATLFTQNSIVNNSTTNTAHVTFYGYVNNNSSPIALNATPFAIAPGASLPILTGATSVYLVENTTTYTLQSNTSYYLNYVNNIWTFNTYISQALLLNNYNTAISNLIFNNSSNTAPSAPQSIGAYQSTAIPSNSSTANFTDLNASITVPVISTISSSIFSTSIIKNTSTENIGIVFYGTLNGQPNMPFNQNPGITVAPEASINIFNNTLSLQVIVNNQVVLDTATLINPLPLNISYDIIFSNNMWSIAPQILTLMNNFNEYVTNAIFYNNGSTLPSSYTSIVPWATIPIPATATSAQITYPSGIATIPLSIQYPSKVFTNTLLINNSDQDVLITFLGELNGSLTALNDAQINLLAGDSIPFLAETTNITIVADEMTIALNSPINTANSYEITTSVSSTRLLSIEHDALTRAASSNLPQSTSALGVLRFLGGSTQPLPKNPSIALYGQNSHLFKEYLYTDLYSQVIIDNAAQTAAAQAVNLIVDNYGINYRNQTNFNYISYFYLINDQLTAAQALLIENYPNSTEQITSYFRYIQKRITTLLA